MNEKHLIDPENLPLWTASAFVVALLALVIAFFGVYRTNMHVLATQTEVLLLSKKIQELSKAAPPVPQASLEKAVK